MFLKALLLLLLLFAKPPPNHANFGRDASRGDANLAGMPVVGGNGATRCSRTLAAQNGSIAPPTRLHLHLTNGVILPYPDETRYTPSSCPDAQKRLWTPWCEVNRMSAILSGRCIFARFHTSHLIELVLHISCYRLQSWPC